MIMAIMHVALRNETARTQAQISRSLYLGLNSNGKTGRASLSVLNHAVAESFWQAIEATFL